MPSYEYVAIDTNGKRTKGAIDAENLRAARQRLRGQGVFPTDIREGIQHQTQTSQSRDLKKLFKRDRIGATELSLAARQLATLLSSGLPLVAALQALSDQTDSATGRRTFINVKEQVEEGAALNKALSAFPRSFPRLFVNMVAAGETSGNLDQVLDNLASYLERQLELRRKVASALFYPVLMLGLCILVVVGLVMFVVPMIVEIFDKQGGVLPLPTRIVIFISDVFVYYWFVPLGLVFLMVWALRRSYATEKGRAYYDRLILKLPLVGKLYLKIASARIATTIGTLLSSGVGLLTALEIARNIIGNVHLQKALDEAKDGVREGRSLARELARSGYFPNLLSQMIGIGETSGKLESMLDRAGRTFENEANATLAGLATLLEPLMIIGVGVIVLCIVISILMPMLDMISVMQK